MRELGSSSAFNKHLMASHISTASGAVAGSTSSSSSGDSPHTPKLHSSSLSDTCSCFVNATSAAPRSCYACVNIALLSGDQVP